MEKGSEICDVASREELGHLVWLVNDTERYQTPTSNTTTHWSHSGLILFLFNCRVWVKRKIVVTFEANMGWFLPTFLFTLMTSVRHNFCKLASLTNILGRREAIERSESLITWFLGADPWLEHLHVLTFGQSVRFSETYDWCFPVS